MSGKGHAEVLHIGGASLGQNPRALYDESLVYFYRKHYGRLAGALLQFLVRAVRV